jgi:UDP-GlcNAc:undecaprenyl-phosphate GlcNAc-1-phosphate transferase
MDDRFETPAILKLVWQIFIAGLMFFIGYRVTHLTNPLGTDFSLGWMSFLLPCFGFCSVQRHQPDRRHGRPGLRNHDHSFSSASDSGFPATEQPGNGHSAFLMAGNLAFLRYNFYPARIFLGETGALFIALNIAAISTAGSSQFKGITSMTLMIPLAVLAIPVLDVALAFFRRIKLGHIFTADKAHIHHTMLAFGFSQRTISLIVYIVTLLFGLIAIGFSLSSKKLLFSVLLGLLALMVVIAYLIMRREKK